MYVIYTAVLRAVLPGRRTACTYCQDGMYAVFAGAKNSHEKITIFRGAQYLIRLPKSDFFQTTQIVVVIRCLVITLCLPKCLSKAFDHRVLGIVSVFFL